MLVLSRRRDESVVINNGEVVVTVVEIRGDKVRIGFAASHVISIHRAEVQDRINAASSQTREVTEQEPEPATRMITVRLGSSLHQGIRSLAESRGISMNQLCVDLMRRATEEESGHAA